MALEVDGTKHLNFVDPCVLIWAKKGTLNPGERKTREEEWAASEVLGGLQPRAACETRDETIAS